MKFLISGIIQSKDYLLNNSAAYTKKEQRNTSYYSSAYSLMKTGKNKLIIKFINFQSLKRCKLPIEDRWILDKKGCQELQKLKRFVNFVAKLPDITEEQREHAEVINWLIENIDRPETYKRWWCGIGIRYHVEDKTPIKQLEEKVWSVRFIHKRLSIYGGADFYIPKRTYDATDYWYDSEITFDTKNPSTPLAITVSIDDFIASAMDYKSHINEKTKEIDIYMLVEEFENDYQ